jgi:aminoglycoside 3-N-acetyltransferase
MLKFLIVKYSPKFLLEWAKKAKKKKRRNLLAQQQDAGKGLTKGQLLADLRKIGIKEGDSLLVHSSLSKIGYIEGGAKALIDALFDAIGPAGTLLMPAFTAKGRNKDYLEENPTFDLRNSPSQMGVITEYFRRMDGVCRSFHPTDSICAKGPLAEYYTNTHYGQLTPYNEYSPFRKLCEKGGKILMLGTTLNGACTNLHTLEDALDFEYPVYGPKIFEVQMVDGEGKFSSVKTKVHNPEFSAKRNCDALKPMFEKEGVLVNGCIGEAKSMLIDANRLLECMIKNYKEKGVTMYTPFGKPL